ncbi:MAG: aldehyde dehydrogenase family protein [Deltaproteobacteria bacterium]|nr:aldehyde dehydrogenase family protein [Deltaproteobacteria bacterium]MCB9786298.1 aldehyde dehydrogenase family protein [Deltaproteobacteria bacterium]
MESNLIAGEWRDGEQVTEVRSPWSGELLAEVAEASAAQVEHAIARAHASRAEVAALPVWRRAEICRSVAAAIGEQSDALARTLSAEAAKPIDQARGEVARAIDTFTFAGEEIRSARGEVIPMDAARRADDKWAMTRRFPAGVVSAITPFNFPLNLVAHKLAPALAAGCPIVLKPAASTPRSALALARIILEAGWPPEALSVFNAPHEATGAMVTDPRPAVLSFTGSDTVGWELKARCGKKRVILELGGDAAVIVEPDAPDWDAMVGRIATGAFAYAGQVCISVQRVYVHRDVYERFVADLEQVVRDRVKVGAPDQPGVVMSALIDERAVKKVSELIDGAEAGGARRLLGGHREGRIFDPMILTEVPPDSRLARTELFGPGVIVEAYDAFDEALAQVNRSRFGLQAGLFTQRLDRITQAFETLEVGALLVGEVPTFRVDHMPYGGVKDSGLGREGLRYAIHDYTEERLLVLPR